VRAAAGAGHILHSIVFLSQGCRIESQTGISSPVLSERPPIVSPRPSASRWAMPAVLLMRRVVARPCFRDAQVQGSGSQFCNPCVSHHPWRASITGAREAFIDTNRCCGNRGDRRCG